MSIEDRASYRRRTGMVRRRVRPRDDGPGPAVVLLVLGVLSVVALVAVIVAGVSRDDAPAPGTGSAVWRPGLASPVPPAIPVPIESPPPSPTPSASTPGPAATRLPARTRPATRPAPTGPALTAGSLISLEPAGSSTGLRLRHRDFQARIDQVGPRSTTSDRADATFRVRTGLGDPACVSFEAVTITGSYLRHQDFVLKLQRDDRSALFAADATFCPQARGRGGPVVLRAVNFPRYLLARDTRVVLADVDATAATAFLVQPPP